MVFGLHFTDWCLRVFSVDNYLGTRYVLIIETPILESVSWPQATENSKVAASTIIQMFIELATLLFEVFVNYYLYFALLLNFSVQRFLLLNKRLVIMSVLNLYSTSTLLEQQ